MNELALEMARTIPRTIIDPVLFFEYFSPIF